MKTLIVSYCNAPVPVNVPDRLAAVMDHLASVGRCHFAHVTNHQSGVGDPKCIRPTVSNLTFLVNPKYGNYLEKQREAVENMSLFEFVEDVSPNTYANLAVKQGEENAKRRAKNPQDEGLSLEAAFDAAKADILASISDSQSGVATDGNREGHRLCYGTYTAGHVEVKVHFETDNDDEGHKRPVIGKNGLMTVNSIMLPFFTVSRKIIDPGEWKPTNSKLHTMMKEAIREATGLPAWKAFSLGKENFEKLTCDGVAIYGLVHDELANTVDSKLDAFLTYLAGWSDGFMATLQKVANVVKA